MLREVLEASTPEAVKPSAYPFILTGMRIGGSPLPGWVKRSARTPSLNNGSGVNIENHPMDGTHARNAKRFVSRLVKHGASHVSVAELVAQAQIIWTMGSEQEVSEACLHAEEFMASAAPHLSAGKRRHGSHEVRRRQEGRRLDERSEKVC